MNKASYIIIGVICLSSIILILIGVNFSKNNEKEEDPKKREKEEEQREKEEEEARKEEEEEEARKEEEQREKEEEEAQKKTDFDKINLYFDKKENEDEATNICKEKMFINVNNNLYINDDYVTACNQSTINNKFYVNWLGDYCKGKEFLMFDDIQNEEKKNIIQTNLNKHDLPKDIGKYLIPLDSTTTQDMWEICQLRLGSNKESTWGEDGCAMIPYNMSSSAAPITWGRIEEWNKTCKKGSDIK